MSSKPSNGADFFGGGVWSFYPDSMLIRTPLTPSELAEFHLPAVLKEMDYSALLADSDQPWQDLLLDDDYNAIMRLWSLAFPEANLWWGCGM